MANFIRTLNRSKLKLNISPGDGHCFLYSFVTSWNSQHTSHKFVDLHELKCNLFVEGVQNFNYYSCFLTDQSPAHYFMVLKKYLLSRSYNLDLVDVIPTMAANAFGVNLNIFNQIA